MLSIKIKGVHQCQDTKHVYAIVRATHMRATWCPQAPYWWLLS